MGYTHYFTFKKGKSIGKASDVEAKYQRAILDCQRIVKAWYKENGALSGYTAHTKLGQYGGIEVNGKGDDAHEPFILREHFSQNFEGFGEGFHFCKTAQKPYDTVVTACLAVLKHRLGIAVDVSSDGDAKDWIEGIEFARKVTKLKIKNPIEERFEGLRLVS